MPAREHGMFPARLGPEERGVFGKVDMRGTILCRWDKMAFGNTGL